RLSGRPLGKARHRERAGDTHAREAHLRRGDFEVRGTDLYAHARAVGEQLAHVLGEGGLKRHQNAPLQAVSYHRRMWTGMFCPAAMYFTCAATVRFRSESCPLGSRSRAVARMVTMELPSMRRRPLLTPTDCRNVKSCCSVNGIVRRRSRMALMA